MADVIRVVTPLPDNFYDTTWTTSMGNVQCISWIYPIHISFAYCVMACGIGCFITRFWLKWLHRWFGTAFVLSMFWCMGASLLIYTTGLPGPIMFFFAIMLGALTIGLPAIKYHQATRARDIACAVDEIVNGDRKLAGDAWDTLRSESVYAAARSKVENRERSFLQRLLSWKTLHGFAMSLAWYQIAGRALVTNPFTSWEGCITYPAMKELDEDGNLVLASEDGGFDDPVGFAVMVEAPVLCLFVAIAVIGSFAGAWWARRMAAKSMRDADLIPISND